MAMVASNSMMNYEDVRKQRMEEKKQKMEALGLLGLSQSLKPIKKNAQVKRPANIRKIPAEGVLGSAIVAVGREAYGELQGPVGFDAGNANAGGVKG
jgi:hypothetical protein